MSNWLPIPTAAYVMASSNGLPTIVNAAYSQQDTDNSGVAYSGTLGGDVHTYHTMAKHEGRPHGSIVIQTSLYVIVATVILVCALIHLFIYRRRRKAKKKKHTYENTKPTKSGRCFLVEPKLFEKKGKPASKRSEAEPPAYKEPAKALCYSIVDITDAVSTLEHFNSVGKSEPDLRKSCNYYESIQIVPQDTNKGFASNAKSKASEATTKLKKFGANKKTKLQRTFQSLTNLCVTNIDSCEDLTKGKDSSKCDYSRLMSPSSKMGRSVGNIYDTLSRQNPWKLAERRTGRYEDIEVRLSGDEKPWTKDERRRYQSISMPKFCPERGQYTEGRFPLAGLAGCKVPQWNFNRFKRQSKPAEYEHVQINKPSKLKSARGGGHKPTVAPKNFTPVYFTLDPSMKQSRPRTLFHHL